MTLAMDYITRADITVALVVLLCLTPTILFCGCLAFYLVRDVVRDHRARKARAAERRVWRADGRVL